MILEVVISDETSVKELRNERTYRFAKRSGSRLNSDNEREREERHRVENDEQSTSDANARSPLAFE